MQINSESEIAHPDASPAHSGHGFVDPDIRLNEYDSTAPLDLSERAISSFRSDVNRGEVERLKIEFNEAGKVTLTATQHVGIVSISDGPILEIRPKATGTNLLNLLRYAQGVDATTLDREITMQGGPTFIDAIGYLFATELKSVITRGLQAEYKRINRTEEHLRGRLNVQRQLQKGRPQPLDFDCEYDHLTTDTNRNRAILYATTVLLRLARDRPLRRRLQQYQHLMRRHVTLTPIGLEVLDRIELTHLNDYYSDLLRLTALILRNYFVRNLRQGARESFSLLVDMNRIFEKTVERAVTGAFRTHPGWSVDAQHSSQNLVLGGRHTVTIRPDILIRDSDRTIRLVGDAKWKLGSPSNTDIFQIAAYQLAHDAPGMLLYPEQGGEIESEGVLAGGYPIRIVEVPTRQSGDERDYEDYIRRIEHSIEEALNTIIDNF